MDKFKLECYGTGHWFPAKILHIENCNNDNEIRCLAKAKCYHELRSTLSNPVFTIPFSSMVR